MAHESNVADLVVCADLHKSAEPVQAWSSSSMLLESYHVDANDEQVCARGPQDLPSQHLGRIMMQLPGHCMQTIAADEADAVCCLQICAQQLRHTALPFHSPGKAVCTAWKPA